MKKFSEILSITVVLSAVVGLIGVLGDYFLDVALSFFSFVFSDPSFLIYIKDIFGSLIVVCGIIVFVSIILICYIDKKH